MSEPKIEPRPFSAIVRGLPSTTPFVGPETQERQRGAPFAARLGANESAFGPAPSVRQAIAEAAPDVWMYGDPELYELRLEIADHAGVAPANILIGEGIDGLLGLTARLFLDPGDAIATSLGAYPTFNYHVAAFGGRIVAAPYRDAAVDVPALGAVAEESGAKLVYISNPDNPTGSLQAPETILRLLANLPPAATLCLDEAYLECAPAGAAPEIDPDDPRVLRFRTFSKVYGLAGLRVGYAIGAPEVIRAFDKIRNHFGVGRLAQAAARAALRDQGYLAEVVARIDAARRRIGAVARDAGLTPLPSAANFVAIDCGRDGAYAAAVLDGLIQGGVFARKPVAPELAHLIRVSCGPDPMLDTFADALRRAVAAANRS